MKKYMVPFLLLPLVACGDDDDPNELDCNVTRVDAGLVFALGITAGADASSLEALRPGCPATTAGLVTASGDTILRLNRDNTPLIINRGSPSSVIELGEDFIVTSEIGLGTCNAQDITFLDTGRW